MTGCAWIDQVCTDCGEQADWVCVARDFNEGYIKVAQTYYDWENKKHVVEHIPGRCFLAFKCEEHYATWVAYMESDGTSS